MKKALFIAVLIAILSIGANAQDYSSAIGLRGGTYGGVTFKHNMSKGTAFEALLSTDWGGYNLTGLYEIEKPAFDVKGMRWYYGVGAHVGNYYYSTLSIGIDGIIGLEYTFKELPINLSIDYKPAYNLTGYTHFWGGDGAFSIRYYWH